MKQQLQQQYCIFCSNHYRCPSAINSNIYEYVISLASNYNLRRNMSRSNIPDLRQRQKIGGCFKNSMSIAQLSKLCTFSKKDF